MLTVVVFAYCGLLVGWAPGQDWVPLPRFLCEAVVSCLTLSAREGIVSLAKGLGPGWRTSPRARPVDLGMRHV